MNIPPTQTTTEGFISLQEQLRRRIIQDWVAKLDPAWLEDAMLKGKDLGESIGDSCIQALTVLANAEPRQS